METLQTILDSKKIKLTPPQKVIADRLLKGYKIIVVNQHRMNGGEWMWIADETDLETIMYAGSVYKAFWGLDRNIRKSFPDFKIGTKFISNLNVKY